jgi:hypothetical protein
MFLARFYFGKKRGVKGGKVSKNNLLYKINFDKFKSERISVFVKRMIEKFEEIGCGGRCN